MLWPLFDAEDALHRESIIWVAAKAEDGLGRIGDHATGA